MQAITREKIESAIAQYQDSDLKTDLISAKAVKNILIGQDKVTIDIVLGYPADIGDLTSQLKKVLGDIAVEINISIKIESHVGQRGLKGLADIKNIIAVGSGKGGVGKSTVSVNLALALSQQGARVGILDADIYGPSQPLMLGAINPPEIQENKEKKILLPIVRHGIQSMSIGYLVDPKSAMIWRGPMVSTALQQLLNDTHWENLDYLIVDLPPGTGDIQLTMAQKIPVSAAVIVTTPQDLALLDAQRAYEMFKKVNIPVLGVVENMSSHICSHCGKEEWIFGKGGGEKLASNAGVELLGNLPLDISIREQTDAGTPPLISDAQSHISSLYKKIASRIAAKLSLQEKNYSSKFPNIVVKHD